MADKSNVKVDNCRLDNVIYLGGDTSDKSWAGTIGDDQDMSDDEVTAYVQKENPELFNRLHGMKFGSSSIPMSFHPQRSLRYLEELAIEHSQALLRTVPTSKPVYIKPSTLLLEPTCAEPRHHRRASIPEEGVLLLKAKNTQENKQPELQTFDGVGRDVILAHAEGLYPHVNIPEGILPISREKNVTPDHAFNYPPNSEEALHLRALNQLEINRDLAEVAKYDKAIQKSRQTLKNLANDSQEDASVLITRPEYMEPAKDRYKKQGLTRYDREKENRRVCHVYIDEDGDVSSDADSPTLDISPKERHCYCREPQGVEDMIRCTKVWCPVGWFHLRCTDLDRLPFVYEEFYCAYCSDSNGPLVTKELLDGAKYPENDPAGMLVDRVQQAFLNQKIQRQIIYIDQDDFNTPRKSHLPVIENNEPFNNNDDHIFVREPDEIVHKVVKWRAVNDEFQTVNARNVPFMSAYNAQEQGYDTDDSHTIGASSVDGNEGIETEIAASVDENLDAMAEEYDGEANKENIPVSDNTLSSNTNQPRVLIMTHLPGQSISIPNSAELINNNARVQSFSDDEIDEDIVESSIFGGDEENREGLKRKFDQIYEGNDDENNENMPLDGEFQKAWEAFENSLSASSE